MDNWRRQVPRGHSEVPVFGIRRSEEGSDGILRSIYQLKDSMWHSSTRLCYKSLKRGTFFHAYEKDIKNYIIPLAIKVQL